MDNHWPGITVNNIQIWGLQVGQGCFVQGLEVQQLLGVQTGMAAWEWRQQKWPREPSAHGIAWLGHWLWYIKAQRVTAPLWMLTDIQAEMLARYWFLYFLVKLVFLLLCQSFFWVIVWCNVNNERTVYCNKISVWWYFKNIICLYEYDHSIIFLFL